MVNAVLINSIIQRQQNLIDAPIDGETVMMNMDSGQYFGLDGIASRIWNLIESPAKVTDICVHLQNEYDVDIEQCESDVIEFLNRLLEFDMIEANENVT